jgi:hypothetical protein
MSELKNHLIIVVSINGGTQKTLDGLFQGKSSYKLMICGWFIKDNPIKIENN